MGLRSGLGVAFVAMGLGMGLVPLLWLQSRHEVSKLL